jgi:hypothetical protein
MADHFTRAVKLFFPSSLGRPLNGDDVRQSLFEEAVKHEQDAHATFGFIILGVLHFSADPNVRPKLWQTHLGDHARVYLLMEMSVGQVRRKM